MPSPTRFETQIVGALPVFTDYLERLDVAAAIDRVVPWDGDIPLGTLTEILILNRLLRPKALFRIGDWAQNAAVTDYYGLSAAQLNDDCLGRALERLAQHAEVVETALVLRAIDQFELDVSHIHYDITDVELFGAYEVELAEGQTPPTPLPTYGRTKSGRKNVKQVQLGLNVTGDGGIPVSHRPLDGNAAEAPSHLANLRRLSQLFPKRRLLYLSDTKLDTPTNLLAIAARRGHFLCGGALSPQWQQRYLRLRHRLRAIAYFPQSQANRPAAERDQYKAHEVRERLHGSVDGRPVRLDYRLLFVWSQAKARQEAATRERHVAKIRSEFEAVQRNLGRYSLKTREAALRRLEAAKARYAEGALFVYELQGEAGGPLQLQWRIDAAALAEWQHLEGVYLLKTNLPRPSWPAVKVLRTYREQSQVERRFHHLKGPLAVAPMFLKNPERIAGLLCVLVWALMVLALMERQVRRQLRGQPLYGLYPENRPSAAPTGPALIECFSTLCIVIVHEGTTTLRRLAQPTATQRCLLELLDLPPSRLRTFKRRCGM
jgi:transposase